MKENKMDTKVIKSGIYHRVEVTTDRGGRMSIAIYQGNAILKQIIEVELPSKTGEYKDAFEPVVKIAKGIEVTTLDGGFLASNV